MDTRDPLLLELETLSKAVTAAAACEDVFGELADLGDLSATLGDRLRALAAIYRRLAKVLHPDRYRSRAHQAVAHAGLVRLNALREGAEAKLRRGTYGDRAAPAAPEPAAHSTVLTHRDRTYVVGAPFARGDLCRLYDGRREAPGAPERVVVKIVACAGDGDLLEHEAAVLGELYPRGQREEKFYRYLPRLEDSFVLRGDGGTERRVNVLAAYPEHVSLAEVMGAHPRGLDVRDVAWMLKRLLAALGFVHREGFVHGAVVPPHVLVHPLEHGARLVDWCYASRGGAPIAAVSRAYRAYYPPEVLAKAAPTPATDIFMAATCAVALLGGNPMTHALPASVPSRFARLLETCLAPRATRRPDDAWALHDDLDALLGQLVGPSKYRPLAMPARA